MQRAVLNWSAMRVAEATAEAVFGWRSLRSRREMFF